ncbi:MAG: hypothetical protein QUS35_10800 [bacterium]|nr:hypothetical protein [bacterium]
MMIRFHPMSLLPVCLHLAFLSCGNPKPSEPSGWDTDRNGIPRFVTVHAVDISRMSRISRFRSGVGPDVSDDFERCRSMLHYFEPRPGFNPEDLIVVSPVDGTVSGIESGERGSRLSIRSSEYPDFEFRLSGLLPSGEIRTGTSVSSGRGIGTFWSGDRAVSIAVAVRTPSGTRLVSLFDVQTVSDSLFAPLRDCEAPATPSFIISREERDSHPLVCEGDSLSGTGGPEDWVSLHCKYDVDAWGIPRFAESDYIETEKIMRVSRFRSGIGHDYSDDFESCRSMKHYFQPKGSVDWSAVRVFSPVRGTVVWRFEEWMGTQVWIRSADYPDFEFGLFHLRLADSLAEGQSVAAGQWLGTHISDRTYSDIAVSVRVPGGRRKLISFFDVMTDPVFDRYRARGASGRGDFIIPKDARDADPLCSDGTFTEGNLENWVVLTE